MHVVQLGRAVLRIGQVVQVEEDTGVEEDVDPGFERGHDQVAAERSASTQLGGQREFGVVAVLALLRREGIVEIGGDGRLFTAGAVLQGGRHLAAEVVVEVEAVGQPVGVVGDASLQIGLAGEIQLARQQLGAEQVVTGVELEFGLQFKLELRRQDGQRRDRKLLAELEAEGQLATEIDQFGCAVAHQHLQHRARIVQERKLQVAVELGRVILELLTRRPGLGLVDVGQQVAAGVHPRQLGLGGIGRCLGVFQQRHREVAQVDRGRQALADGLELQKRIEKPHHLPGLGQARDAGIFLRLAQVGVEQGGRDAQVDRRDGAITHRLADVAEHRNREAQEIDDGFDRRQCLLQRGDGGVEKLVEELAKIEPHTRISQLDRVAELGRLGIGIDEVLRDRDVGLHAEVEYPCRGGHVAEIRDERGIDVQVDIGLARHQADHTQARDLGQHDALVGTAAGEIDPEAAGELAVQRQHRRDGRCCAGGSDRRHAGVLLDQRPEHSRRALGREQAVGATVEHGHDVGEFQFVGR